MSDAVNSIDTSALETPGCSSYVYTQRSYEPFIRDVFDQFSETRHGGAFTFMTGIGGFLQEFLYGYSGLRWNAHECRSWTPASRASSAGSCSTASPGAAGGSQMAIGREQDDRDPQQRPGASGEDSLEHPRHTSRKHAHARHPAPGSDAEQ